MDVEDGLSLSRAARFLLPAGQKQPIGGALARKIKSSQNGRFWNADDRAGNKYRVVAAIGYARQIGWIRFVGTHAQYDTTQYDTINAETV